MDEVEGLVTHDLSLSVRVLRAVNSAAFGIRHEVTSLRHALVLLGLAQVRKWASVWAMASLGEGDTSGLVGMSLVRARCCEYLGEVMPQREGGGYFLLGLCSMLDIILRRPMNVALEDLPLPGLIRDALLGRDNLARTVLEKNVHYQRGDWDAAYAGADRLNINFDLLPDIYADAIRWARDLGDFAAAAYTMAELSTLAVGPDSRQSVTVARQPILDRRGQVIAHELLYRHTADATSCTDRGDSVGAR